MPSWENEFKEFENRDTEEPAETLNKRITQNEVAKCFEKSKSAKSPGFDSGPLKSQCFEKWSSKPFFMAVI